MKRLLIVALLLVSACTGERPQYLAECPDGFHIEFRQVRLAGESPYCISNDGRTGMKPTRTEVTK